MYAHTIILLRNVTCHFCGSHPICFVLRAFHIIPDVSFILTVLASFQWAHIIITQALSKHLDIYYFKGTPWDETFSMLSILKI